MITPELMQIANTDDGKLFCLVQVATTQVQHA